MQFVAINLKDILYQAVSMADGENEQLFTLGNFEITDKLGSLVKFKQFLKRKEALPGQQSDRAYAPVKVERMAESRRMQ